jgi:Ca2+-binding RTX toxin-like protein
VRFHQGSNFPKQALSLDCCRGDNDTIFGGDGEVDYLVGGGMHDVILGEEGPDLVFGDHALIIFDVDVSHKLKYARTTNHSCAGGNDTIFLGGGDVSER